MGEYDKDKKELACLPVDVRPEKDYRRKGEGRELCHGDEVASYLLLVGSAPPRPVSGTRFITGESGFHE